MDTQQRFTLGIDVSRPDFDVALLLLGGKRKHKKFPNNQPGFLELKAWLARFKVEQLHACLEATNTYGQTLALTSAW